MKSTTSLLFFGAILLISCKKETTQPEQNKATLLPETIISEITKSEIHFSDAHFLYDDVRGCSFYGTGSKYEWDIDFRIGAGYEHAEKVFYPIEKKWHVALWIDEYEEGYIIENIDHWDKETAWEATGALYRYDPNTQLALKYVNEQDTDPEVLMNFKMIPGDTWTLQSNGQIRLEVIEKFEFTLNDVTYPALLTDLKTGYGDHELSYSPYNTHYILTPLNPNPLMLGMNYADMLRPNWKIFQVNNEPQPALWPTNGFNAFSTYDSDEDFFIEWESDSSVQVNERYLSGRVNSH